MKQVLLSLGCVWVLVTVPATAEIAHWPNAIVAISSDHFPVTSRDVLAPYVGSLQVLNLDTASHIEQRLSQGLPPDETLARALAEQRIAEQGRYQLEAELREAYQALAVAMTYQLDRYPAIVIDKQWVIYGVTDLVVAVRFYRQWLARQSNEEACRDE